MAKRYCEMDEAKNKAKNYKNLFDLLAHSNIMCVLVSVNDKRDVKLEITLI